MGRSLLQCFFHTPFFFSLSNTHPMAFFGERVSEGILGLWFCRVCDAMLWQPCFPREFTGVFQPDCASSWRERTAHPKHSHVLERLFLFFKCDHARPRKTFFFLALLQSKGISQISIICNSNLLLEKLCRKLSNYEILSPLMSDNGHIHDLCSVFVFKFLHMLVLVQWLRLLETSSDKHVKKRT